MSIAINPAPPKRRAQAADETVDHQVSLGEFFGTTGEFGAHVWYLNGSRAVRVGIPNPDYRSSVTLQDGECLRVALSRVPMLSNTQFVIHRMQLPPGAFYPRMARPSDQYPMECPGSLPDWQKSASLVASTLNQLRTLVGMLETIFQAIHPVQENMHCFGNTIRNLLMLACTECEAQWRGILTANGIHIAHPSTKDYVKLVPAMRLAEYTVSFSRYPWLDPVSPFADWDGSNSTKSIFWYENYNAVKHNREVEFNRATVESAIQSIAAIWIMIAAQFGRNCMNEFSDLDRYFFLEAGPLWRYSEIYTAPYIGFNSGAGPSNFPF